MNLYEKLQPAIKPLMKNPREDLKIEILPSGVGVDDGFGCLVGGDFDRPREAPGYDLWMTIPKFWTWEELSNLGIEF